jgi:hypothetical protein
MDHGLGQTRVSHGPNPAYSLWRGDFPSAAPAPFLLPTLARPHPSSVTPLVSDAVCRPNGGRGRLWSHAVSARLQRPRVDRGPDPAQTAWGAGMREGHSRDSLARRGTLPPPTLSPSASPSRPPPCPLSPSPPSQSLFPYPHSSRPSPAPAPILCLLPRHRPRPRPHPLPPVTRSRSLLYFVPSNPSAADPTHGPQQLLRRRVRQPQPQAAVGGVSHTRRLCRRARRK